MKSAPDTTLLLITPAFVARADISNHGCKHSGSTARPTIASLADAVSMAIALGGKPARQTWVLFSELRQQKVTLSPAQITGLTREQLSRAIAFEVEPFSGIPVAESAVGFNDGGGGVFTVVQTTRRERNSLLNGIAAGGSRLSGIIWPGQVPAEEELDTWWTDWPSRIAEGKLPVIYPPAREPSPHRFLIAGIALTVAAIIFLIGMSAWQNHQRRLLEAHNDQLNAASRDLETANRNAATLRTELEKAQKEASQRGRILLRRSALSAVLRELAMKRPHSVIVESIEAEGPSTLIVSGLSLEAEAVDELGILLTQSLQKAGWYAQPRQKTGLQNLANGGPWEFSLAITHQEAAYAAAKRLTLNDN